MLPQFQPPREGACFVSVLTVLRPMSRPKKKSNSDTSLQVLYPCYENVPEPLAKNTKGVKSNPNCWFFRISSSLPKMSSSERLPRLPHWKPRWIIRIWRKDRSARAAVREAVDKSPMKASLKPETVRSRMRYVPRSPKARKVRTTLGPVIETFLVQLKLEGHWVKSGAHDFHILYLLSFHFLPSRVMIA